MLNLRHAVGCPLVGHRVALCGIFYLDLAARG
jgi:hypothetical protein